MAALALLISQFTQERRTAAGITGGLLLVCIVLDMVHRVVPDTEWLSRLSPVYYYNLSKPLVPSYGTNPGALLVLLALSVLLSGAALWLFMRRDIGRTVALPRLLRRPERAVPPARALPVKAWSLRSVYARSLATIAVPTVLVDAGHRRVCRLDGLHRRANGATTARRSTQARRS